jgi:hypothetical protein
MLQEWDESGGVSFASEAYQVRRPFHLLQITVPRDFQISLSQILQSIHKVMVDGGVPPPIRANWANMVVRIFSIHLPISAFFSHIILISLLSFPGHSCSASKAIHLRPRAGSSPTYSRRPSCMRQSKLNATRFPKVPSSASTSNVLRPPLLCYL